MSRFSPTVAPNSGEAFGRALQQSVGAYLQARQQKQQDEAEMLGRGYIPAGSPAAPQPTQQGAPTPTLPAAPVAPQVDQGAIARMGGAGALPVQSPIAPAQPFNRGAVTPVDQLGAGQGFSAMLGAQASPLQVAPPQPQGATSQSLAKAAGLDTYNSPSGGAVQPSPVHLLGRDWQMTPLAQAEMAMKMATARAGLEHTASETDKNRRELTTLRPQDAGYADMAARNAAAVAGATMPIEVQKAVDTAIATLPVEIRKKVIEGDISLSNALQQISARGKVEAGLQGNQQTFTAGQNNLEREFRGAQTDKTINAENMRQAGQFANESALSSQNHRSSVFGRVTAAPAQTVAPSLAITDPGAMKRQQSDWDAAAVALRAQKKNPDAILGPRP